jgi:hypothetical protein
MDLHKILCQGDGDSHFSSSWMDFTIARHKFVEHDSEMLYKKLGLQLNS